jgi:hypothetical protein
VGAGVAWGPEGAESGVEVAARETCAEPPGGGGRDVEVPWPVMGREAPVPGPVMGRRAGKPGGGPQVGERGGPGVPDEPAEG